MELIKSFIDLIMWDYCLGVVLMGYLWKFRFKIAHPDVKWAVFFLAILAGVVWWLVGEREPLRLFVSYFFVTSFYELILIYIFNWLESKFKK